MTLHSPIYSYIKYTLTQNHCALKRGPATMVRICVTMIRVLLLATFGCAHVVRIPLYRTSMRATLLKSVSTTKWYNGNKPCLKNATKTLVPLVEEIFVVHGVSYGEPRKPPLDITGIAETISRKLCNIFER